MNNTTKTITSMALALSLVVAPLAGCAGQGSDASTQATEQTTASAPVDVASWKTLGDALGAQTESMASGCDEKHYVAVFAAGDTLVRVVAELEPGMYEKINELDYLDPDHDKKLNDIIGGLPLESAEDITSDALTQEQLDALVGKTGKELVDDGFIFKGYYMYGAEGETGVTMDKGYFSYGVTFDATVTDDQTEDEGAAIMDAKVTGASRMSASDSSTDTTAIAD